MKLLIIILLLFSQINATNYEGTINNEKVFLSYDFDDYVNNRPLSGTGGVYFFDSNLENVFLESYSRSDTLFVFGNNHCSFMFMIDKNGVKDSIVGEFIDSRGFYQPVDPKTNSQVVVFKESKRDFDEYKRSKIRYTKDSTTTVGYLTLDWYHEEITNLSMFKIVAGLSEKKRAFINDDLQNLVLYYIDQYISCVSVELEVEIVFLNKNYLSVEYYSSIYCGSGGYHNHRIKNYDLKNERILTDLTSLYPTLNRDKLVEIIIENYASEVASNPDEFQKEIDYFHKYTWNSYRWRFDVKGIIITPTNLNHRIMCEKGLLISYDDLQKYK